MKGLAPLLTLPLVGAALAADGPIAGSNAAAPDGSGASTEIEVLGKSDSPAAPPMQVKLPPFDLQTKVFDFPTGMRIMFQADNSYPVVSVYMIVAHGSSDDPPGKDEVAHFVEHTWFRSLHGTLPPIMDVVNDLSGFFNASTWNDWTNYSTVANSDLLPVLLRLESLRLTEFYTGMTEEKTATEREVIRNEWRRRNENNIQLLFDYMYNVVYPENHPYHSTSTHDTIDHIELKDLQGYVDQYYKPDQTTITIVGDFDPATASSLIFENFDLKLLHPKLTPEMLFKAPKPGITNADPNNPSHWLTYAYDPDKFLKGEKAPFQYAPPGTIKPRVTADRPPVPALGVKEIVTREAPVEKPFAMLGWSLPGGYRADHVEMQLLGNFAGNIIFGSLGSEWEGKIGEAGCFAQPEVVNTTLMCLAELKDKDADPEDLVDAMLDQVYLVQQPPDPDDAVGMQLVQQSFARARNEFLAQELLGMDQIASIFGGRADSIGTYAHLTGDPNYYTGIFKRYGDIELQPILKMATEFLKRDRAARLIVKPLPDEQVDISSAESGYIAESKGDSIARASDDLAKLTPAMIAGSRVKPDLTKLQDYKLPNGLRVVVMPHAEVPLVKTSLILGGGPDTFDRGVVEFMQEFTQGSGQDPLRVAGNVNWAFYPGVPGAVSAVSWPTATQTSWGNAWRMDFSAPSGNLDNALWTIRNELDAAHPYLSGAGDWKKARMKSVKRNWGRLDWNMSDMTAQHLFPNAPWQQAWTYDQAQAAQDYDAETITNALDRMLQPSNAVLLIVGNVKPDQVKKSVETYFGGWAGRTGRAEGWAGKLNTPDMPTEPTRVLLFEDPKAPKKTQSQTDLQCRLNYRGEEDRAAVTVLGSILSDRAFTTLRVQEALSYTPYAYTQITDDGAAILGFGSLALNKGVGRTVEYFMEAAKTIEDGKFEETELIRHKLRTAREAGIGAQSLDGMARTLTAAIIRNDPWTKIEKSGEYIASVDRAQLVRLMQGCTAHALVTIDGPTDVIKPQLEEKKIAYEVVDWKARGDALLQKYDPKAYEKKMKAKAKEEKAEAKKKEKEKTDEPAPDAAPAGIVLRRED